MKTVLVTGAGGFVGTALVSALHSADLRVIGMFRGAPEHFRSGVAERPARTVAVFGDVADRDGISRVLVDYDVDAVIHLAAHSAVKKCEEDPWSAYRTNVLGIVSLLDACRLRHRDRPLEKIVVATCYDERTRAVTTDGLKTWDQIRPGDEVLSFNTAAGTVEPAVVQDVLVHDYEGPMVQFRHRSVDLLVTPHHNMLVSDRGRTAYDFVRADAPLPARGYKMPMGRWCGEPDSPIPFPADIPWNANRLTNRNPDDVLYLLGIYIGDGVVQHQHCRRPSATGLSRADWLKTARTRRGQFQTIGRVGTVEQVETTSNAVFLYIPEADSCRPKVEAVLTRLGVRWSAYRHAGEGMIGFSSLELCAVFETAGRGAAQKRIPEWALRFNSSRLEYLLEGILDSDGSRGRQLITTSFQLVSDMALLCARLGKQATFARHRAGDAILRDGRCIRSRRPAYAVYLRSRPTWVRPEHVRTQTYRGKVWCLVVPPHRNFLVERNGRFHFCGNTDKIYGDGAVPYREDQPLQSKGPYSTSKVCADFIARDYGATYGLPVVVARSSNVYGPGDTEPTRLIPGSIQRLLRGESAVVYEGALRMEREFVYIADEVSAYLMLLFETTAPWPAVFNIGGSGPVPVVSVVKKLAALCGGAYEVRPSSLREIGVQYVDASRLRALGWRQRTSLDEGLRLTVEWFRRRG